jgi:hypothetical protein
MSLDFDSDMDRHGGSRPGKVVLVDVHSHTVIEIRTLPRNDTQALIMSAEDNWIVWEEAADVMGFSDAMIFTYNRATHALTSQALANVKHPTTTDQTSYGIVVWAEPASPNGFARKDVIQKLDLATGQTMTLADNAYGGPRLSWPYVSWLQVRESTPQITTFYIVVLNLQTGLKKTLHEPYTWYDIHGSAVVWATRSGEVVLTDVDETYQRVLMRGSYAENMEGLNINDRLVSWYTYGDAQVWDRALGKLVNIGSGDVTNQFLSGNDLVWQSFDPMNTRASINVLDTSTLQK